MSHLTNLILIFESRGCQALASYVLSMLAPMT
jgi:hypothetical protein